MKVCREGTNEVLYKVSQVNDSQDPKSCRVIFKTPLGVLMSWSKIREGLLHSVGSPAYEEFDEAGDLAIRAYYENGLEHNLSGPSLEVWNKGALVHTSQKIWGMDAFDPTIQEHIEQFIGL